MVTDWETRTRWPISNAGFFSASDGAADESTDPDVEDDGDDDEDTIVQRIGLCRGLVAIGTGCKNASLEFIGAML